MTLEEALQAVPGKYRRKLIDAYRSVKAAYVEGEHDVAGIRVGRFAELMLRVLQELLTATSIPLGTKIPNFADECLKFGEPPEGCGSRRSAGA